jgi:hypothetical protein
MIPFGPAGQLAACHHPLREPASAHHAPGAEIDTT